MKEKKNKTNVDVREVVDQYFVFLKVVLNSNILLVSLRN